MKNIEIEKTELQKILHSYKLTSPIENDVKNYIRNSMGSNFKKILKKYRHYGIFTAIVSSIYFFLKKNGVLFSILKIFSSVVIVSSSIYGPYMIYDKYYSDADTELITQNEIIKNESQYINNKNAKSNFYYSKKLSLKAFPFNEQNVSPEITREVLSIIHKDLNLHKGTMIKNKLPEVNYLLTGSLMQLNNKIILFIKIIDINSSEIVYTSSNKVQSREELLRKCRLIVTEIPQHVKNNP